jgi:hypothetical protein
MTRHKYPNMRLRNDIVTSKRRKFSRKRSGGRSSSRGRGRGGEVRCYTCGKSGHKSWQCPKRNKE